MAWVQESKSKRWFWGSIFLIAIIVHTGIQLHLSNSDTSAKYNDISELNAGFDPDTEKGHLTKLLRKRSVSSSSSSHETLNGNETSSISIVTDGDGTATLLKPISISSSKIKTSTASYPPATRHTFMPSWPYISKIRQESTEKPKPQNPKNHPHITDWSDVPKHFILKNHYGGNFSLVNLQLCEEGKRDLKLVILITSVVDHFEQREAIRLTWGHYGAREDVAFAFVIGDALLANYSLSTRSQLRKEMDLYSDFIMADFEDTYRNLTLKTLHMFDWVSTYCKNALYFLKTDDDVFLNVPEILNFIDKVKDDDAKQPKIYGHVFSGHFPKRDVTHKHHLKYDVYPHNVSYPNFTSGPAYLLPTSIVRQLFTEALKLPFIPLEDVLINGFAAMNLGIPRVDVTGFLNETENPINLTACAIIRILAGMSDGSAVQMNYIWYNWLMGRTVCIWQRNGRNGRYVVNR